MLHNAIYYALHTQWSGLFEDLSHRELQKEFIYRYRAYQQGLRRLRDPEEDAPTVAHYVMGISDSYLKMIACMHLLISGTAKK